MELTRLARTAAVKEAARQAGFARVGVARAAPAERFESFLAALARGDQADMAWLARPDTLAKRRDPAEILPDLRSLVVVAESYWTDDDGGPVARYARGEDYHQVLSTRLKPVVAAVESLGGRARAYVDTGPILEVQWAARAGLGWIGRNGLLLSRDGGTWWLLGVVLTTLELEPDEPVADHCGSCTRCLDACPTDAFRGPYRLDSRRCLSYLTIEHRGPIPEELREGMGEHLFGCDVCQEVCPWSRKFPVPAGDPALRPRPDDPTGDLSALLSLSEAGFRARFAGSPLSRPKRRGLLRNVCVVLGNRGDPAAIPALTAALSDDEPLIREHAAWALARIGRLAAGRRPPVP